MASLETKAGILLCFCRRLILTKKDYTEGRYVFFYFFFGGGGGGLRYFRNFSPSKNGLMHDPSQIPT